MDLKKDIFGSTLIKIPSPRFIVFYNGETLQKKCESLYHYIEFVERVKNNQRNGMDASAAINEAVDYAIQHDFLEGFFKEQKMYILTNLLTEFDQELHDRCTREAGYEEGVADGAQKTAIANAKKLIFLGVPPETVAEGCALPLEQVLALRSEMVQA